MASTTAASVNGPCVSLPSKSSQFINRAYARLLKGDMPESIVSAGCGHRFIRRTARNEQPSELVREENLRFLAQNRWGAPSGGGAEAAGEQTHFEA
jgi:hypothetical protein